MSPESNQGMISSQEKSLIEDSINRKLDEMGRLRDFFGSGHGVDIVTLISSWIEREIVPHEVRLGVKIRYALETQSDGTSRFVITGCCHE